MAIQAPVVSSPLNDSDLWEGMSGDLVENYIKNRFKKPINVNLSGTKLHFNAGEEDEDFAVVDIAAANVKPDYVNNLAVPQLRINGNTYSNSDTITVNGVGVSSAYFYYTLSSTYNIAGTNYTNTAGLSVNIGFVNNDTSKTFLQNSYITKRLAPTEELKEVNIKELFDNLSISSGQLAFRFFTQKGEETEEEWVYFPGRFEIKTYTISYDTSAYVIDSDTITLTTSGDTNGWLQYKINNNAVGTKEITDSNTVTISNLVEGPNTIIARFTNAQNNPTLYSQWISFTVIKLGSVGMVAITNIPSEINDCDSSTLFNVITTDKKPGESTIYVFKSSVASLLNQITTSNYLDSRFDNYRFKTITQTLSADTAKSSTPYSLYLETGTAGTIYLKFIIVPQGGTASLFYQHIGNNISATDISTLSTIPIVVREASYNENGELLHTGVTEGKVEDFSQITLGTLFNSGINPNLDTADGFKYDSDYTYYKVSPISGGLFSPTAKTLRNIGNAPFSDQLSVEFMIKTYNISDPDDEIFRIGNIKVYPTYMRIDNGSRPLPSDANPEQHIYNASIASFASNEVTHVLITFDNNYRPSTYDYDKMYPGFSTNSGTMPCLKIYINGTVNRVVKCSLIDAFGSNSPTFLVNPTSTNVNFYIFRTYNKCLNYQQILRNRLSAFIHKEDKNKYYLANDIYYKPFEFPNNDQNNPLIGRISLDKCLGYSTLSRTYEPKNVILYVLDDINEATYIKNEEQKKYSLTDTPFYYGCRKKKMLQASILVRYDNNTDPNYKNSTGRLFPNDTNVGKGEEYYKGQGSSAKKYGGAWNTQYAKFNYQKEEDFGTEDNIVQVYTMPDEPNIEIAKTCGKINYASSMQSHKQGACRLYNDLYKRFVDEDLVGRKAVNEYQFFYFYVLLSKCTKREGVTLKNVTWDDFDHKDAIYFGFQTWGSAKGDKKSFNLTGNEAIFEGADNKNPCTNFKTPWAAQLMWDPDKVAEGFRYYDDYGTGKLPEYYQQLSGLKNGQPDYITGLYIWDETIQYRIKIKEGENEDSDEKNPDSWDLSAFINDPSEETKNKKQCTIKSGKEGFLNFFAEFYNKIYTFDATSLKWLGDMENNNFNDIVGNLKTSFKYVVENAITIYPDDPTKRLDLNAGDVIRYDYINEYWVPAGLYYNNTLTNKWDKFNVIELYNQLRDAIINENTSNPYYSLIDFNLITGGRSGKTYFQQSNIGSEFYNNNGLNHIKKAFGDMFKCVINKYMKISDGKPKDCIFHQGMMRTLSGTDNRAKNTYWIVRKVGDSYIIELFQDDLDTIFQTDNNGQLVKPYQLMEPPFNTDTISMWGDDFSGFFTNFDIIYENDIKVMQKNILDAIGKTKVEDKDNLINKYFLSIQNYFPSIAYNHTSEIYYETIQMIFSDKDFTPYGNSMNGWSGFTNNQVKNPVSLIHGSCLESETQFLNDRLLFLGTYSGGGYNSTGSSIKIEAGTAGGDTTNIQIKVSDVTFNKYTYPDILSTKLDHYTHEEPYPVNPIDDVNLLYDGQLSYVNELAGIDNTLKYIFEALRSGISQLTGGGGSIDNTDLVRSIKVEQGQRFLGSLNFPNAEEVTIDTSTEAFTMSKESGVDTLDVAKYLGCVKKLTLKGVTFDAEYVKFTDCTRLEELDLSDVTTIKNLTLPRSNKLKKLTIPSNLEQLIIGNYPLLSKIDFTGDSKIENLIIDARNSFVSDLIDNHLSNTPNRVVIENNTGGLTLSTSALDKLLNATDLTLSGTINITGNVDWKLKEKLAIKYNNIDSPSNKVYCVYDSVPANSIILDQDVVISLPDSSARSRDYGLRIVSSDGRNANNMTISNYKLNLSFSTNREKPNYITVYTSAQQNGYIGSTQNSGSFVLTVTYGALSASTTITLGFREPKFGDFAYSDGSFSAYYNSEKDPIGWVYYVNSTDNINYETRVMALNPLAPCKIRPANNYLDSQSNYGSYHPNTDIYPGTNYSVTDYQSHIATLANTFGISDYQGQGSGTVTVNPYSGSVSDNTEVLLYDAINNTPVSGKSQTEAFVTKAETNYKLLFNTQGSLNMNKDNYTLFLRNCSATYSVGSGNISINADVLMYPAYLHSYFYKPTDNELYTAENNHWYVPNAYEVSYILKEIVYAANTSNSNLSVEKFDANEFNRGNFKLMSDKNPGLVNIIKFLSDPVKFSGDVITEYYNYNYTYRDHSQTYTYKLISWGHKGSNYTEDTDKPDFAQNNIYPCITINVKNETI